MRVVTCPKDHMAESNKVYYCKGFKTPYRTYLKVGIERPHIFLGESSHLVEDGRIAMNKVQRLSCKGCSKEKIVKVEEFKVPFRKHLNLKTVKLECRPKNSKIPVVLKKKDTIRELESKLNEHFLVMDQNVCFKFRGRFVVFTVKKLEFDCEKCGLSEKFGRVVRSTKFKLFAKDESLKFEKEVYHLIIKIDEIY